MIRVGIKTHEFTLFLFTLTVFIPGHAFVRADIHESHLHIMHFYGWAFSELIQIKDSPLPC